MTIHARSLRRLTLEILSQRDRSPDSKRNIVGYKVGSRKTYRHVCCSVRSFLARWIVSKRISKPRCSRRSERSDGVHVACENRRSMRLWWCDQCWEQEVNESEIHRARCIRGCGVTQKKEWERGWTSKEEWEEEIQIIAWALRCKARAA